MYRVTISSPSAPDIVDVFRHPYAIEPCLEFALALHRSSIIPHCISVFRSDECLITLTRKENPTENNEHTK